MIYRLLSEVSTCRGDKKVLPSDMPAKNAVRDAKRFCFEDFSATKKCIALFLSS